MMKIYWPADKIGRIVFLALLGYVAFGFQPAYSANLMEAYSIRNPLPAPVSIAQDSSERTDDSDVARLLLWFDAARIAGLPEPNAAEQDGQLITQWSSLTPAALKQVLAELKLASPANVDANAPSMTRVAVQADEAAGPKLLAIDKHWVVRFDGLDDHLRVLQAPAETQSLTVFIVAAAHENPGDFRGLLASNAPNQRDYQSGFTIDLGPGYTPRFSQLSVEGRGFGGTQNLRTQEQRFGAVHILQVDIDAAAGQVRLSVDGKLEGTRSYEANALSLEQWTLGGRFYTNGPGEQIMRGPFSGDLAEVIVFDGNLNTAAATSLYQHLQRKYAGLSDALAPHLPQRFKEGVELVKVADPPPIQMFSAGFEVTELPIELTNVNNVRYRQDGKLFTLGYNGDLHLLHDSDGDGLEDTARLFWKNEGSIRGPIGIVLTPPDYALGQGVFVASKGKVSLIVDTDGDDVADQEILVASGWNEIPQNVDAVGLAMGPDGSLYFGLGTTNFANGYLIDAEGKAHYDLASDRGTVQRVSPDFKTRETVATGVRFPIAFAFNHHGDLFCTDQEGATWLANGNPLDELLHIPLEPFAGSTTGMRHYGFPPRHPRHLPNVIDEPSTYDFGPQHQSTCGMVFNESVWGGPVFGPDSWAHQALVCGESRGKIWRTMLSKTPVGYVADSQLIAGLQMLTIDACVSPRGDLIVACHSGPPDWGTGPLGIGKLFRIRMTEAQAARPVAVWAESPHEVRVAFDHPLDNLTVSGLQERTSIQFGQYVRAGDRYENLVPPYAVIQRQFQQPRYDLPVYGASVTPDLRTIILNTAPIRQNVHHAIILDTGNHSTEVDFAPTGVAARWRSNREDGPTWEGYLPHLDLQVAQEWLQDSAGHEPLWSLLREPGVLTLETTIDLGNAVRPAIQIGESLDYELPPEVVSLCIHSNSAIVGAATSIPETDGDSVAWSARLAIEDERPAGSHAFPSTSQRWVKVQLEIETGTQESLQLYPSFFTEEDSTRRPLQKHRFLMPWAPLPSMELSDDDYQQSRLAQLSGGDWGKGRRLFHSETAQCYKCHRVGFDSGGEIGPDLGNLVHRDYTSVLRDIELPSYSINPDYVSQMVELSDGRILTGVLRSHGDKILLGDAAGKITEFAESDVARMQPSAKSVMPDDLWQKLEPQQQKDLITYLLSPPPSMPLDSKLEAPPLRTRAEIAAALAGSEALPAQLKPLNIVLVDGVKDHGPGEHDYPAWQRAWTQLLRAAENVKVTNARDFPSEEQLETADIVIFFQKGSFDGPRPEKLDQFLKKGGGVVLIHWAVNGNDQVRDFAKRIGLASWGGRIKFRHGPLTLDVRSLDHPIVRNFEQLQLYDESYWELTGDLGEITLLATSTEDGMPTPQMWVRQHPQGRVFVSIPGHYNWTFDDPLFRILLLRGIAWTADEPIDRFNELVPLGARIRQ